MVISNNGTNLNCVYLNLEILIECCLSLCSVKSNLLKNIIFAVRHNISLIRKIKAINFSGMDLALILAAYLIMCTTPSLSMVTRSEWGAKPSKLIEYVNGSVPFVLIHHSYIPPQCNTTHQCKQAMQSMQTFHQVDRGWNDIGYNFAIGGDGQIYEGRGFDVIGAHAPKYNVKSVGICLIGDWTVELPSNEMIESVHRLIDYGVKSDKIQENYTLLGHRQVRHTECPGDRLFNEISTWKHFSSLPNAADDDNV